MTPCIAIIDSNTLNCISLKDMIENIFPTVEVVVYKTIAAFYADCNRHFVHFFISDQIMFENADDFDMLKKEVIVLSSGKCPVLSSAGFKVLDITLTEVDLVQEILRLHEMPQAKVADSSVVDTLSDREKDVLVLIVKGYINKEIAEKLSISLTTAIFHRNNICEKLGTRSVGKLTVIAVLSGLITLKEI